VTLGDAPPGDRRSEPGPAPVPDLTSATDRAVTIAREYLVEVLGWLGGRRTYGAPLADSPVLRQRLAAALVELRAAEAIVRLPASSGHDGAAAVDAALRCLRLCETVHAGAGVFDSRADAVRRMHAERGPGLATGAGGLAGLQPDLAGQIRALRSPQHRSVNPTADQLRRLVGAVDQLCPAVTSTLTEDLVIADALAETLPTGAAARIITHRQVVRSYLSDPGCASLWESMSSGGRLAAIAVTEPHTGSDLSGLRTVLRPGGDGAVLEGTKTYIAGGADCDIVVVAAISDAGPVLAWAEPAHGGVERRPLPARAWQGVGFASMTFHGAPGFPLPAAGSVLLLDGLVRERAVLAAMQLAYASRWLPDLDPALGSSLALRVTAAQALLLTTLANSSGDRPPMVESSAAKLACCAVAAEVAEARVYSRTTGSDRPPVSELLADDASARACTIAGGTADVNLAVVEGSLLALAPAGEGGDRQC
jgi:alkylation response protein AidB-like acyl-CoA dehydrogenase